MIEKWDEFNELNEKKKKDPNAPKFGTPEYWEYLKNKKKDNNGDDEKVKRTKEDAPVKNPHKFGTPEFFKFSKKHKKKE